MPYYSSNDPKRLAAYNKKKKKADERKRVDEHMKPKGPKKTTQKPKTPPKTGIIAGVSKKYNDLLRALGATR
jgi:hypothetical protein